MKDSRLIEILKTFSKAEVKSLGMFLNSPFVSSRRNLGVLLEALNKYYPDFDSDNLTKENIFKRLFPKEKYSDKRMINLMSDLTKETENFLKHHTLENDGIDSAILTGRGFYNKKLFSHTLRLTRAIEKKLKPGFSPSKDYFSKLRQMIFLKSAYYTSVNDFENMIECKKNYFEASAAQFIIDLIQLKCSKDAALMTYGRKMENSFILSIIDSFNMDKFFRKLEKTDFTYKPIIEIHYYLLKTSDEPENKLFYFRLRDSFYKNLSGFDREEKYFIFNHLATFCSDEVSRKNESFYKEALDVYKRMLENNAYSFSESEYMQVVTYRNIIYYCNTVRDYEWFEFFIDKFTEVISPKYREDMRNFAAANLFFLKNNYEKSLVSVSKISYEFFLFKPDLKNILLKIYYELDHFDQAFSLIDTYRHFLFKSDEIQESYKVFYRNFVDKYNALLKIKSGTSKESASYLKTKIEKVSKIVNKVWLLEKAEELIRKKK